MTKVWGVVEKVWWDGILGWVEDGGVRDKDGGKKLGTAKDEVDRAAGR